MGTRIKTYDATGVAPNGRLYAGDLNAIQDQYADQSNLAQTLGVGTIQLGETGLQFVRYGAGEARITGAVRTDGILRALGGFYAGAFTTNQRDAIPSGSRPYGLVILNTNSNRLEINLGSDASPSWSGLSAGVSSGTLGSRPAAASSNANNFYLATDDNGGTLYYSTGATWVKAAPGITQQMTPSDGSVTTAKFAASAPIIPLGAMLDWPWDSGQIPSWATLPYGQLLAQTNYPAMQTLCDNAGRPYGGTAGVNFGLPDMRGRVAVGKDDMGGSGANRITVGISGVSGGTLGGAFGAEGITLTTGQLPAHNHGITGSPALSGGPALSGAPSLSGVPSLSGAPDRGSLAASHNLSLPNHAHGVGAAIGNAAFCIMTRRGEGTLAATAQGGGNYGSFTDTADTDWPTSLPGIGGGVSLSGVPGIGSLAVGVGSLAVGVGSLAVGIGSLAANVGSLGTANNGSGGVHQNTQPSIIVNKIIRIQ